MYSTILILVQPRSNKKKEWNKIPQSSNSNSNWKLNLTIKNMSNANEWTKKNKFTSFVNGIANHNLKSWNSNLKIKQKIIIYINLWLEADYFDYSIGSFYLNSDCFTYKLFENWLWQLDRLCGENKCLFFCCIEPVNIWWKSRRVFHVS